MKIRLVLATLCLAAAVWAAGVEGKWKLTATASTGQKYELELNLAGAAPALKGTLSSEAGSVDLQDIRLEGDQLSFKFPLGSMFEVKATVTGDTMKGTYASPDGPNGVITATRAASQAPAAAKVDLGEINGSNYRIDMPQNWNGGLVVYCHGYGGNAKYDEKPLPPQIRVFTDAGYAVAQAGYRAGGWAVQEALDDTEALRAHFAAKYGKPKRTFVTGHSMGGIITLATIETYPDNYDGALPLCGPLDSSLTFMQKRLFDTLVVFDYYYPGAIGSPVKIADSVKMSQEYVAELQKVIDADPQKRAAMTKYAGFATEKELAIGVAFFANIQRELMTRSGGNPFDNRNTIYHGAADDPAINRGVKRYAADAAAREYLKRYYTPTGKPVKPVLAVHTIYDPIVPAWSTDAYGELTRQNGNDTFFVQRYVAHPGHCAINADETLHAFQDLLRWVSTTERPSPGEQK